MEINISKNNMIRAARLALDACCRKSIESGIVQGMGCPVPTSGPNKRHGERENQKIAIVQKICYSLLECEGICMYVYNWYICSNKIYIERV